MNNYVQTLGHFDRLDDAQIGYEQELHLSDTLEKVDSLYGVLFKGESYYIENRLDWFKTSSTFALDGDEFRDNLAIK